MGKYNIFEDEQAQKSGITDFFTRAINGEAVTLPDIKYDTTATSIGTERSRWLSSTLFPLRDNQDQIDLVIIAHNNITERKELERQLQQTQKMETVGILASGIVHDINNVLTPIHGTAELMMLKRDKNHPDYQDLKLIKESVQRATKLMRHILSFSHKTEPHLAPLPLNQEIITTAKFLERTLPKSIEIILALAEEDILITADSIQIQQILLNLTLNAKDAITGSGIITIKTGSPDKRQRQFLASHGVNAQYIVLSVMDTGEGIPTKYMPTIFEPFFTTKEVGQGTGLGLAMVSLLVKAHHGYIDYHSSPGIGTTFEIYLPIATKRVVPEGNIATTAEGNRETILIVDDEVRIVQLCERIFEEYGYHVQHAHDHNSALSVFKKFSDTIDLVLVDLNLPGKNGITTANDILKLQPDAKIILMTGYPISEIGEQLKACQTDTLIRKPFAIHELINTVRQTIES
jgi:signal transduction histidine kinase/ActR/RegA family two-component response regulator